MTEACPGWRQVRLGVLTQPLRGSINTTTTTTEVVTTRKMKTKRKEDCETVPGGNCTKLLIDLSLMFRNEMGTVALHHELTISTMFSLFVLGIMLWTDDEVIKASRFRPKLPNALPPCIRMYARYSSDIEMFNGVVTKRGPCWRTAVEPEPMFSRNKIVSELKHQPTRYQNKLSINQI